jgi:hypothetical protein
MLSEKLLIGIGVDTFSSKKAIGGVNLPLSLLKSLFSFSWLSHQVQAVISGLFYLKDEAPSCARTRADLWKSLSRAKLSAMS